MRGSARQRERARTYVVPHAEAAVLARAEGEERAWAGGGLQRGGGGLQRGVVGLQRGCMGLQPAKGGRAAVIERDAVVLAALRGLHALERAWLGLGLGLR